MVQSWSPMIPESYPGLFWDPATGKMSSQHEIMSRLHWPTMSGPGGDIPYQYNPPRPRGFLGMEYPLVQGTSGAQWGYNAETPNMKEEAIKSIMARTGVSRSDASFIFDYQMNTAPKLNLAKMPMDQRTPYVISHINNDKTLSMHQKIVLFKVLGMGADLPNLYLLTKESEKLEQQQTMTTVGGVAVIGIVSVVGYMMYRRKKK